MPRTKKTPAYFDLTSVYDGVRDMNDTAWLLLSGNGVAGLSDGDCLLIDRSLKKPKFGDYVAWEVSHKKALSVRFYSDDGNHDGTIYGIAVVIVRKLNRKKNRRKSTSHRDGQVHLSSLRDKLTKIERLPENEAERFKLETEVYQLEHGAENPDLWPDVIGGDDE